LEAGIAYWHTIKADTKEKWENILQLYADFDNGKAISHLQNALALAKSTADKMLISNKIISIHPQ
jgi:RNA polymerase sigma-70 factor (ECF subfamily)